MSSYIENNPDCALAYLLAFLLFVLVVGAVLFLWQVTRDTEWLREYAVTGSSPAGTPRRSSASVAGEEVDEAAVRRRSDSILVQSNGGGAAGSFRWIDKVCYSFSFPRHAY